MHSLYALVFYVSFFTFAAYNRNAIYALALYVVWVLAAFYFGGASALSGSAIGSILGILVGLVHSRAFRYCSERKSSFAVDFARAVLVSVAFWDVNKQVAETHFPVGAVRSLIVYTLIVLVMLLIDFSSLADSQPARARDYVVFWACYYAAVLLAFALTISSFAIAELDILIAAAVSIGVHVIVLLASSARAADDDDDV